MTRLLYWIDQVLVGANLGAGAWLMFDGSLLFSGVAFGLAALLAWTSRLAYGEPS